MTHSTGRAPPGRWRLLGPAGISWASTAAMIPNTGSAQLWAVVAGVCGAGLLVVLCAPAAYQNSRVNHRRLRGFRESLLRFSGFLLITFAIVMVIGVRVTLGEYARASPWLSGAAASGEVVEVNATLSGYVESARSEFGERSWVRARIDTPRGAVPALVWLAERPEENWAPGLRLRLRGGIERLDPAGGAAVALDAESIAVMHEQSVSPAQAVLRLVSSDAARLRTGLREIAQDTPGAELVPGFALGDTSLVPEELDRAMLESSLSHLTAVSGANCALVTGAVLWVLARIRATRRIRLAVAAASLLGFVLLVGPDASVQRAAVMAGALLASGFGGKRAVALPALGLAMFVLLTLDPWQALQPGFALSVVATAGILLLANPCAHWLRRRGRIPRLLALPIAVAIAAQVACAPVLLLLQPGVSAVGVAANVLAAPAAPIGTGLGLLAAVTIPLEHGIAELLVSLAAVPARWVELIAHLASGAPLARWFWPDGWLGAITLSLVELALLAAWGLRTGRLALPALRGGKAVSVLPRIPWGSAPTVPRSIRLVTTALRCAAFGTFIAIVAVMPAATSASTPGRWAVVACDVGQGDAILLRDPDRPDAVMLVDTGDDPDKIDACLNRFGVRRIALLVLSHDDRDHVGALGSIVDRVDAALISPTVAGLRLEDRDVVRRLDAAGVPYRVGEAGEERSLPALGPSWRILAPAHGEPADSNAASLVMLVDAGTTRVLLLADTGLEEQERLLRDAGRSGGAAVAADVVKIAHHGSRDQDPRLPVAVGAKWALVSVGAENGYGHPSRKTLASFSRAGSRVLRTDLMGSLALSPGPDGRLDAWVERSGVDRSGVDRSGVGAHG